MSYFLKDVVEFGGGGPTLSELGLMTLIGSGGAYLAAKKMNKKKNKYNLKTLKGRIKALLD